MYSKNEKNSNFHSEENYDATNNEEQKKNLPQSTNQNKEKYWLQYLAAFLATLPAFLGGNAVSWSSPSLSLLLSHDPPLITSSEASWIAALCPLGSIFWCFFIGIITEIFGRKICLLSSAPSYLISLILLYTATNVAMLYAGRIIAGYGVAVCSMVCSLYIGEISEKHIRGRLLMLIQFMSNFGSVVSLSIGPYVTYYQFLIILSIFPIVFFITFIFMPESPYFKIKKGDRDGAKVSISQFYRTNNEDIINEKLKSIEEIVHFDMANKSTYWELVSNSTTRKSLIVILGIKTIMHLSGISAIQSYVQPIFDQTNSSISPAMVGILCGLVQTGAGVVSYAFVDNFGRKPLLLVSLVGCAISLTGTGAYFFVTEYLHKSGSNISWLPVTFIMVFMAVQPIGVGSVVYVLLGELFPVNLKENAGVVATTYGSIMATIVIKLFGIAVGDELIYVGFFTCAICMVLGIFFTIFWVPETKRKSLNDIQKEIRVT